MRRIKSLKILDQSLIYVGIEKYAENSETSDIFGVIKFKACYDLSKRSFHQGGASVVIAGFG